MKHAIVRTDLMKGTHDLTALASVKVMGADDKPVAVDNGSVVKLAVLMPNMRDCYKGVAPAADTKIRDLVLVATPELKYDKKNYDLAEYVNEAGTICRGYRLHSGEVFSLPAEGLIGSNPAVGSVVELAANSLKLSVAATPTAKATTVGTIVGKETGSTTYFVIEVQ